MQKTTGQWCYVSLSKHALSPIQTGLNVHGIQEAFPILQVLLCDFTTIQLGHVDVFLRPLKNDGLNCLQFFTHLSRHVLTLVQIHVLFAVQLTPHLGNNDGSQLFLSVFSLGAFISVPLPQILNTS